MHVHGGVAVFAAQELIQPCHLLSLGAGTASQPTLLRRNGLPLLPSCQSSGGCILKVIRGQVGGFTGPPGLSSWDASERAGEGMNSCTLAAPNSDEETL